MHKLKYTVVTHDCLEPAQLTLALTGKLLHTQQSTWTLSYRIYDSQPRSQSFRGANERGTRKAPLSHIFSKCWAISWNFDTLINPLHVVRAVRLYQMSFFTIQSFYQVFWKHLKISVFMFYHVKTLVKRKTLPLKLNKVIHWIMWASLLSIKSNFCNECYRHQADPIKP